MIEAVDALQPAGRVALAGPAQHAQTLPQGGAESRGEAGQGGPVQPDRREAPDIEAGENEENRSEEHTSELQSLMRNSYAVFCLKKKKKIERSSKERRRRKSKHVGEEKKEKSKKK